MVELLGGTLLFLLGVSMALGIGMMIVNSITYVSPPLRRVRFADRSLRVAVPGRLRWFGVARGRRMRVRSRQRRVGSTAIIFKLLGVATLIVFAVLAGLVAFTVGISAGAASPEPFRDMAIAFGGIGAGGYAALRLLRVFRRLWRERRRLRAATAAEVRAADPRPPIVLLRAFRDDGQPVALLSDESLPQTLEEALVERLARHGPVIAVGSPGEPLPPIGAGREYVSGDWQARVAQLIDEAAAIVVLLDRTSGLLWEIEQVFARHRDAHLIVIVPDRPAPELDERWNAVRQTIENCRPGHVHDGLGIATHKTLAVVFDGDWHPHRIIGRSRRRPYYRDAVELAMWFVGRNSRSAPSISRQPPLNLNPAAPSGLRHPRHRRSTPVPSDDRRAETRGWRRKPARQY
jgi:hypothetical protein